MERMEDKITRKELGIHESIARISMHKKYVGLIYSEKARNKFCVNFPVKRKKGDGTEVKRDFVA